MDTKFAIGCFVQWYEVEVVEEYIISLVESIENYNKENVKIDILVSSNQDLEKAISVDKLNECTRRIEHTCNTRLSLYDLNLNFTESLVSIADYRRTFNDKYCSEVDVLIWGESDMLVPKQAFVVLDLLHKAQGQLTPKYLATFGICKMWDESWKNLEHPDFTDKPFIVGDTKNWWSIPYTMSKDEMNSFNDKVKDLSILNINPHKFNGCGLVISSEVIKSGVNIPKSAFFIHEDTSFMLMTNKVLGQIPQYHIKNILVVHNRKHPKKRLYVAGEENIAYIDEKRKKNNWYTVANKLCEENNANLFNPTFKFNTWKDVWKHR